MKVVIDDKYCKGCNICIQTCPKNVFFFSKLRSQNDYLMPVVKNEDKCINCKLCEKLCPEICISVITSDVVNNEV